MTKHLWEVNHSYYCNEGNYFSNDCSSTFKSFDEFMDKFGSSDMDYNLLFRWDWTETCYDEDGDELTTFNGDVNYRNGQLKLFWMGQRKGLYQYSIVDVCRADEPAVIAFLNPRLAYLFSIWEPLK